MTEAVVMNGSNNLGRLGALGLVAAAAWLAAGCGGGGGGGGSGGGDGGGGGGGTTSITITGKAVDGALQGVTACYDLNDNRVCDAGEPTSGPSAADGSFSIPGVPQASAGAHRVIVEVPASAIDADTSAAVGTAFTLVAPATGNVDAVFVSPLTSIVQQQMDATGQSRAEAAAFIQQLAGLAASPLADFTAANSTDNAKAANVAKLVLLTTLQQTDAVAAAVGQTDISGAAITQAELSRAVLGKVVGALPVIGASAADPSVVNLTGAQREAALTESAAGVVAAIGFTAEQARLEIGIEKLPQPTPAGPQAGANLVALQYTDGANWFMRYNAATQADATPDANGLARYYSVRTRMAPYSHQPGDGVAESFVRTTNPELHWSGAAWTSCSVTDRYNVTPRDAQGRSSYDYCNDHEKGTSQRAEIDISGQSLATVWTDRILVEQARTTNPSAWSLSDVALLGSATFPAGSTLQLQTNTVTATAPTYNTADSNRVTVFPLDYAQGGDARTGTPACAGTATATPAATLEEMVARNPGSPCIYGQQTNDANGPSLDPNEIWGLTTVSMGTLASNVERPAGTGNYYTTNRLLRVSFPSAGNTVYWSCLQRTANNASRNCTQIGTGTYTINTLGDARAMTFNNLPAAAQGLSSQRVFIERGGSVWFGFKLRVGAQTSSVRLNLPASNAVLTQLGLPPIVPTDAPAGLTGTKATNAATMKGVWYFSDAIGSGILRVGDNGRYVSAITDAPSGSQRPGSELGWLDVDAAGRLGRLVEVDANGSQDFSHIDPAAVFAIGADTFSVTEDGVTEGYDGRLPDGGAGSIVGMWALGSATDLAVTQFVFLPNGKALSIHPAESTGACAAARQGPPGIEFSDYSFNAATGVVTFFNRSIDSSGCTGVWDSTDAQQPASVSLTVTFGANGQTFSTPGDNGTTNTFYRIAPR
jgi:hypothetical protein